ncbi:dynein assembly factor 4, axonemal-like isoform X2 [Thrips palmi]|uniref:Dynein axonemal assembly factor 4 n=1 Tax=Thrips palmi TaxID=161013 RepID=A0A6P9A1I6_THRPL|nr:dynein assembly factor 4, axonemal-like isoform X2 [Thrips palmi]XP_034250721.1 dynein assembly factor 4, axonemal-like isoform X2 [Thrips palmi]
MAVFVKDFVWSQTGDHIVVKVPLRGVTKSMVDILTYDTYIKANFKPFIFEAFLLHPIRETSSRCTVSNGELEFSLEKVDRNNVWESLCRDLSKEEKAKEREDVLHRVQLKRQQEEIEKRELLQNLQRKAVQQQIEMETNEKKKVDHLKDTERNTVMADLEAWKNQKTETALPDQHPRQDEIKIRDNDIWDQKSSSSSEDEPQADGGVQLTEDDLRPVPFPRSCGSIKIKFTPRTFPTPQRESQMEEEQAWLKKQAAAQRSVGFVAEDLRPEECNPQWLKDKGDSFFKVGNYLGAISAYSHGIKLCKDMASLYVNRSAAHYAVGNLQRVIEDCSMALELMTPHVRLNEDSRAKCHARRGAALCRLRMLKPGLADLQAALAIKPGDTKLQNDIERVKTLLEKSPCVDDDLSSIGTL